MILDLHLVIECHGEQHYKPVDFGGEGEDQALENFRALQKRDEAKRFAAVDAGFTYIVVPYWEQDQVSEDYIWSLYQSNLNPKRIDKPEKKKDSKYLQSLREYAKQYRKKQYLKNKQWLNTLKAKRRLEHGQEND